MTFPVSKKILIRWLAICILTIVGAFLLRQAYVYFHPQALINFQQYKPTKLPFNLQLSYHELEVFDAGVSFFPTSASIRLSQTGGVDDVSVAQTKDRGVDPLANCKLTKTGITDCKSSRSKNGQSYTQEITYTDQHKEQVTSELVSFSKTNTYITIKINRQHSRTLPEGQWSEVIDSFVPYSFTDLKIKRIPPAP